MKFQDYKKQLLSNDTELNKLYQEEERLQELIEQIGHEVRRCRVSQGVTQKILAEKLKTHQPNIAQIENGSFAPSIKFISKLAYELGSDVVFKLKNKSIAAESRKILFKPEAFMPLEMTSASKNWVSTSNEIVSTSRASNQ